MFVGFIRVAIYFEADTYSGANPCMGVLLRNILRKPKECIVYGVKIP